MYLLLFLQLFFQVKFGIKTEEAKDTVVKEAKAKAIKLISNKLDNIEQKADEVFNQVKKKKKDKNKKKNNN